jgi:hypothetical protein
MAANEVPRSSTSLGLASTPKLDSKPDAPTTIDYLENSSPMKEVEHIAVPPSGSRKASVHVERRKASVNNIQRWSTFMLGVVGKRKLNIEIAL